VGRATCTPLLVNKLKNSANIKPGIITCKKTLIQNEKDYLRKILGQK